MMREFSPIFNVKSEQMNTTDLPKVTVMIPTFNQEKLIARSVESALRQDYLNLEIVVSDDCSSDNTYGVVSRYLEDDRLVYFKNNVNLGRVANYRKTLYERVSGVWALNLDGDDEFFSDDAISHMISATMANVGNELVAVMGSHMAVNSELGLARQPYTNYETGLFAGVDLFLKWDQLNFGHLSTLYKVDVAKAIGYYRLDTISCDWESVLRLTLHGNVAVTKKIIGVWNIHGNNVTMTKSMAEGIRDYTYIEDTYDYALDRGVNPRDLDYWFKKMIIFHTKLLWNSNGRAADKMGILLPYVVKQYPFALTAFLSPRAAARMAMSMYPKLYCKMRDTYRRTGAG